MEIMVYAVTHVTISASEPDANGFSDTRVFGTLEEAKEKLRIWRDEELECRRESNASYVVYTDTDTKFHCTWDMDGEGIIITIRECEIKTPTKDNTTMEKKTIVMLTADLWSEVYDRCECSTEAASMLIGLAERFERELDWKGATEETRDYLTELAKFEDKVRSELQK